MVEHETLMSSIFGNVALVLHRNQHLNSFQKYNVSLKSFKVCIEHF